MLGTPTWQRGPLLVKPGLLIIKHRLRTLSVAFACEQAKFRLPVSFQRPSTNRPLERNTALIALLGENDWLVKAAEQDFLLREGNLDDLVDRIDPIRLPFPNEMQRDERLAEFISLTSTDSWYSALRFLRQHRWNFVRAVDAWIRLGYLPFTLPSTATAGKLVGQYGMRQIVANRRINTNDTSPEADGSTPDGSNRSTPSDQDSSSSSSFTTLLMTRVSSHPKAISP